MIEEDIWHPHEPVQVYTHHTNTHTVHTYYITHTYTTDTLYYTGREGRNKAETEPS